VSLGRSNVVLMDRTIFPASLEEPVIEGWLDAILRKRFPFGCRPSVPSRESVWPAYAKLPHDTGRQRSAADDERPDVKNKEI